VRNKNIFKIAKFLYWVVKKDIEESSYSQISASIVNRAWNHVGRISSFFEEAYEEGASSSSSSSSPSQMDLGRLKYYQIFLLSTEIRTLNMPKCFPNSHPTNSLANNINGGILSPIHKHVT